MFIGSWGNFLYALFLFLTKLEKRSEGVGQPASLYPQTGGCSRAAWCHPQALPWPWWRWWPHHLPQGQGWHGMGCARCFWGLSLPRGQNSSDNSENEAAKCSPIFSMLWKMREVWGGVFLAGWQRVKLGKVLLQEYDKVRKCQFPQTQCFFLVSG